MLLFINVQRNEQHTNLKVFLEKMVELKRPIICHSSFVSIFFFYCPLLWGFLDDQGKHLRSNGLPANTTSRATNFRCASFQNVVCYFITT